MRRLRIARGLADQAISLSGGWKRAAKYRPLLIEKLEDQDGNLCARHQWPSLAEDSIADIFKPCESDLEQCRAWLNTTDRDLLESNQILIGAELTEAVSKLIAVESPA
eukprot:4447335-Karenia_brevis.AAC.1